MHRDQRLADTLDLRSNTIGVEGAKAIAAAVAASGSLTHLDLCGNKIGVEGAKALAAAVAASGSLTHLDTRNNNIFGQAAEQLAKAVLESKSMLTFGEVPMQQLRANELTGLNLNDKSLGPTEVHVLSSLVAASGSLTYLGLEDNQIGVEGAKAIAAGVLAASGSLTHINLFGNQIGDEGAKAIAAAVAASGSLAHLDLEENEIGVEGAKAIAAAVAASGSLALKKLVVPDGLERHAELMAACESKGVELV